MSITDIKKYCIFAFCFATLSVNAQFYIWGESMNYVQEECNSDYKYCYKIEGCWRQTRVYYQMVEKSSFNNRIEIINKNYNNDWMFYVIKVKIDNKDTLIITDTDSTKNTIFFDTVPTHITLYVSTRTDKIDVPITNYEVPSQITILWGKPNEGRGVLTIRSKKELDQKEIDAIRQAASNGGCWAPDYYYYFISDM